MTVVGEPGAITAELAALVERRRPSAAVRRSWASTEPFVAGERVPLEGDEADSWRGAATGYVYRAASADLALVAATLAGAYALGWLPTTTQAIPALIAGATFLVAVGVGHGYDGKSVGDGPRELQAVLRAGVAAVVVPGLATAFTAHPLPRLMLAVVATVLTVVGLLCRQLQRRGLHGARRNGLAMTRTLVVGDADSVHRTIEGLRSSSHYGYRVVGICLPSVNDRPPQDGVPLLGALADVVQVAYDYRVEAVVVAGSELAGDALRRLSWALGRAGADLVVAPGLVEVLGPRVSVRPTVGLSLLEVQTVPPRRRLLAKSLLDRLVGGALMLAATPVILAAALAVRVTSRGPVFFRQARIGIDGRPFTMIKLRSMYRDAEERKAALLSQNQGNGLLFKMRDDPRITPVGKVLRRFSVDELPQLWNVVRGDMSPAAAERGGWLPGPGVPASARAAGAHRAVAGVRPVRPVVGRVRAPRPALRGQLVGRDGPAHPLEDRARRARVRRGVLTQRAKSRGVSTPSASA